MQEMHETTLSKIGLFSDDLCLIWGFMRFSSRLTFMLTGTQGAALGVRAREARGVEHVVRMLGETEYKANRTHDLQGIPSSCSLYRRLGGMRTLGRFARWLGQEFIDALAFKSP
jgi:hypothetical protein